MSTTDPEIPEDPPPAEDGSPEVDDDQPLGPPADMDEDDAPLPRALPDKRTPRTLVEPHADLAETNTCERACANGAQLAAARAG